MLSGQVFGDFGEDFGRGTLRIIESGSVDNRYTARLVAIEKDLDSLTALGL